MARTSLLGMATSFGIASALNLTGLTGCDVLINAGLLSILQLPGMDLYNVSTQTYYSGDNRLLQPYCILQPQSTADVSTALAALSTVSGGSWDVAIRSGGHSDFDNNAVERGVVIDLTYFNQTVLVNNSTIPTWNGSSVLTAAVAQIRPAARWASVYTQLSESGLAVTGGRSGHVGAGGLLLGGGASWHEGLWGVAADNVLSYEAVLANGTVVTASKTENADLWRALKGGGNNFAVVTRYDLRTFTVPPTLYGGIIMAEWDQLEAVNEQFVNLVATQEENPQDHEFLIYVYGGAGAELSLMLMPGATDGKTNSSTFALFNSIPLSVDYRQTQSLASLCNTISDTGGSFYISHTLTLQNRADVLAYVAQVVAELREQLIAGELEASINFVMQPFPKSIAAVNPGGNVFGWNDGNLPADAILFESRATMTSPEQEGVTNQLMASAVARIQAFAAALPDYPTYLYLNYANAEQDVLGSYGEASVAFMKDVSARYDPTEFFQYRVPGGWKLNRV